MSNSEDRTHETSNPDEVTGNLPQEATEASVTPSSSAPTPPTPPVFTWSVEPKQRSVETVPTTRRELRDRKPIKEYWGGIAILCSAVGFLLAQVLVAVSVLIYLTQGNPNLLADIQDGRLDVNAVFTTEPLFLVFGQLSMYVAWLACLWWVTQYRSGVQRGKKFWTAFKENFWFRFKIQDIAIGLGLATVLMGVQLLVLNGLPVIFPDLDMTGAGNTDIFASLSGPWYFIIAFGIGGILGPICEELFFRGFLLRGLSNHFSYTKHTRNIDDLEDGLGKVDFALTSMLTMYRAWAHKHRYTLAVILSSIAFGFMHFQGAETFGQWLVVIVTGILGLVLAITTIKLNRIAPAIIAHVAYNTASFVILTSTLGS